MVEQLDVTFQALADPTRRLVLGELMRGSRTLGDLAEPFAMSLPAVQKHIRVLEVAGLVATEKIGRSRHVRLRALPLKQAVEWMNHYQKFWNERFDALEELLETETHELEFERTCNATTAVRNARTNP
jgi:DNA-binding transcriptional ArsR family regulator